MGVSTCPDCKGPVDVVQMGGTSIRCGCGRTQMPVPPQPRLDVHHDLRSLIHLLRANKVTSYRAANCEITLSPDSWATVPATVSATPPPSTAPEMCTCGHALHDHTQAGCTIGCDLNTCGLPGEEKAA